MLIDTHCHLEKKEYKNLETLLIDIFNTDVKIVIVSGYDVESSIQAVSLAHSYNNVYATVGFHPNDCKNLVESDYAYFDDWLKDDKVVGVGEIGLDYYYGEYGENDKDEQIKRFKRQIEIACKYKKPIIVHNRNASEDIYNILKKSNTKGIIHCFNDDINTANKFINLGFLLGIGGIITFKNNKLKNVIKDIDVHNIVLETDSPYLSPEPFRGTQNNPINVQIIAGEIAKIKDITYSEVAFITTANASRLFDLNPKI
jgi:TatD DNase family protein